MDAYETALKMAMTAEGAKTILESLVFRKCTARANGKTVMTTTINAALCRAIESLDKEIKEGKENGSGDC